MVSNLSNKKQCGSVNGVKSNTSTMTCWVPQGFVVGPSFFSIYYTLLF